MVEDDEEMVTVNVVCTILLFVLVLPKLKESAAKYKVRPVFSITSSVVHESQKTAPEGQLLATISDETLAEKHWDNRYPTSKLLGVFFVREFTNEHPPPYFPVTLNYINYGPVPFRAGPRDA